MSTPSEKVQAPTTAGPPMNARGRTVTVLIGTPNYLLWKTLNHAVSLTDMLGIKDELGGAGAIVFELTGKVQRITDITCALRYSKSLGILQSKGSTLILGICDKGYIHESGYYTYDGHQLDGLRLETVQTIGDLAS